MRTARQWKHIFCLEGLWDSNLKEQSSIEPAMELLAKVYPLKFIHKDCATTQELEYYLSKWTQKKYKDYPILYLAFHGSENAIHLSNGSYTMDQISEILSGKCKNRIIIFSSCGTLGTGKKNISNFLKKRARLPCAVTKQISIGSNHRCMTFSLLRPCRIMNIHCAG